ncbi:MAG: uracil-DNA glycosylase [bacterium]|nr:uracil-DNA glycosylase [bacterium]
MPAPVATPEPAIPEPAASAPTAPDPTPPERAAATVAAAPEPVASAAAEVPGGLAKPRRQLPPLDLDSAFKRRAEIFVAETVGKIARQSGAGGLAADPYLVEAGGDKAAALARLKAEVLPCTACSLSGGRKNTVFGAGDPDADIFFIGEAPGRDEDLQGEPFVGRSGQLLTKIIGAIGLGREDVYIGNILKCRPPENRDPTGVEVEACEPHLMRQLAIIQPRVICCLGRIAAQTLLGVDTSLKRLRDSVHFYAGVPVMATYHPAALLRNPDYKRDTWDDVRRLRVLHDALLEQD